ncbi:hypothetical protein [Rubinisphaera sp.]|uniref:hypothetical protein n=1 Tax=Rubinisphaera sp. TaxID=2024857 RepID=UPI000C0F2DA3|nr:hypothetical protein [Rubinisphaera sp.]MBV12402.1 hypothetical protein [Rubinisphaera sp.]HCS50099.1 hypothetical protein [Planctomycetaceae bacterium]|tara:strand:+ start:924 stop:1298 length:375 start_codon:yes stop_codon:yes gene_type:complete
MADSSYRDKIVKFKPIQEEGEFIGRVFTFVYKHNGKNCVEIETVNKRLPEYVIKDWILDEGFLVAGGIKEDYYYKHRVYIDDIICICENDDNQVLQCKKHLDALDHVFTERYKIRALRRLHGLT